ncbi:retrovirus-related Pol polyprotein from transposon opus [Nephila pilipes]|uniref:Retrovirus-related Pol polyprotein from transposon opus n=1 Tax=Nephila pilipes TaxID=299642 RepID=A0A8X6Q7I0_NEPPI|nr:retrovirus-related Pol polyprotein from transposon opus [Nephila pilipes]
MEVVPLPDIIAEIVGKAFYEHWICRYGIPATIITDQGRQFESQLFRSIAAICGVKVGYVTPYHLQSNGKVERLHRILKGVIKAHNNIKWTESLPTVLLGLIAALRPDVNYTIAQMVSSTCIKLPGEFFVRPSINMDIQNFVTKLQQHMKDIKPLKPSSTRKQKYFVHKELKSCSHVFVRIDRVKKKLLNHHMKAHLLYVPAKRRALYEHLSGISRKAQGTEEAALNLLEEIELDLRNYLRQSYDNASYMSGVYSSLQSRIREKISLKQIED